MCVCVTRYLMGKEDMLHSSKMDFCMYVTILVPECLPHKGVKV